MINVHSFQKIMLSEDCPEDKNISRTSQFIFGQNYKKLTANSKHNFDFRRFIQKHSNRKKHTTIVPKEPLKRNPLEEVSPFQPNNNNPNNLQSKAFKIRCFSRKAQKQNEKQQEGGISKIFKYKPRIYPMKQAHLQSKQKRAKTNLDFKKCIKMHKLDNFQELQSIANNIKVHYNTTQNNMNKITQKAIVFDINYLVSCIKSSATKASQKDKQMEYFRKKVIFLLKRIIQDKFMSFPSEKDSKDDRPQIIFKARNQDEVTELIKTFEQCQFTTYYCIFCIQYKCVESLSTYSLTKIHNLAQNITIVDSLQNLTSRPPLLNSRHFIAFASFSEKTNVGFALEGLFQQNENLDIRFSAEQFQGQEPQNGKLVQIPYKQLLQKVRQKRTLKESKKSSRQKKQRCHSSYEDSHTISDRRIQQRNLQGFKQKMLKYLKIIGNETNLEIKRSRQLSTGNSQDLECMTGREKTSKTNNQIVSELIRFNSNIHKQISGYQKKVQQLQFDMVEDENQMAEYLRFDKVYINSLH